MKSLILTLIVASNMNLVAQQLIDNTDDYPYGDIKSETVNHDHAPLFLALKVRQKSNRTRVESEITLYNNTDKNIVVIESNVFLDFQFEVKDNAGTIVLPNNMLKRFKEQRDADFHSDLSINHGQSRCYYLNLAKIYDFKSGETYSVRVSRYFRPEQGGGFSKMTSAPVQFTFP